MSRRRFLVTVGALAAAPLARGQKPGRRGVLGVLNPNPKPSRQFIANNPFSNRLRELGWVEGETLAIERAYGEGHEDRLPSLAEGLARRSVDVIWAVGPEAAVAAARATKLIPIVFWGVPRPEAYELVDSMSRPGRNATGIAWFDGPGVDTKRVEILRDFAPRAKRLAHLSVRTAGYTVSGRLLEQQFLPPAAETHGFELRQFSVGAAADLETAFGAMLEWKPDAMMSAATTITFRERRRIVGFAGQNRLPAAYANRAFVDVGGLVSYGAVDGPPLVRCAEYVDRILRGERPADLPVDTPRDVELVINLKTARALGVEVPQPLLLRADKVVQ